METAATMRSNAVYNVLVVVLVAGLAAGVALLFLTTSAPARSADLTLGLPESVDCPFGSGAPVCYRFDLVNSGAAGAFVRCEVIPAGDTTAVFGNGETTYEGADALDAGEKWHLYVQVEAGADGTVTEPMVGCGQVS
jgi:hypothetical protein